MATPHEPRLASRHQAGDQIAFHSSAFTVRLAHSGYSLKVAVSFQRLLVRWRGEPRWLKSQATL